MVSERTFREGLRTRLVEEGIVPLDAAARTDLVFNLTRFYNRFGQDSESAHRRHGWTWAGFKIMNVLWAVGPLESRQVGRLIGSSRASISSVLQTLERDGLVARDRSAHDRRQVLVRLTDAGLTRLRDGVRAQADQDRAWFGVLDSDEQVLLGRLLEKLANQSSPLP